MTFLARFGSARAGLGYQFFDASGALLGTRQTAGIVTLPEAGAYLVEATPPAGAAGIYWNSSTAEASEEITAASGPTAAEIAAAVLGSTVPASYEDGTAGAALGRLNNTPAEAPVIVIPDPNDDASLCVVYGYTESLINQPLADVPITFLLSASPTKTERILDVKPVTVRTDAAGFFSVALQRTDNMTPPGRTYLVTAPKLGLHDVPMTLAASTYNLASLIA